MADFLNLPTKEQFDMQNTLLASIASNTGTEGMTINNWRDLQRLVRMGLHTKMFQEGDQFVANYNNVPTVFDVIGINHDIPTDKNFINSLTIQAHDCILNAMFDSPEALYMVKDAELPAGVYHFTYNAIKYQFTLSQPVPIGGQLTFPWAYDTDILTTKISTFESQTSTVAIETVTIVIGLEGTELLNINDINRCRYGSNNYKESAIRQWLNNSAAAFVWAPQTDYDRPPTGAPHTGSGFLNLLDPELVAVIGEVDKQVARNTVTDGGGQDLFSDKVFLLSRVETGYGTEGVTTGEVVYPYYEGLSEAGKIKLLSNTLRGWWLRSPLVGLSSSTRGVGTSGALLRSSARDASGLSPACVII